MDIEALKSAIATTVDDSEINIIGEGCNLTALVVSPHFQGLSLVKRQQQIYSAATPWLESGELHALSIKSYTPEEWEKQKAAEAASLVQLG
jgi:acid stress-induced BolA-like protein IbaG/YrbA